MNNKQVIYKNRQTLRASIDEKGTTKNKKGV